MQKTRRILLHFFFYLSLLLDLSVWELCSRELLELVILWFIS